MANQMTTAAPNHPTEFLNDAVMWHGELTAEGWLRVRIDRRDKSANALSQAMLAELERLLAEIKRNAAVRGVIFISGKSGSFIVGADVTEMKSLTSSTAAELSQFGQRVLEQVESLHVPTVALISGACLGGGLEFAMSCRYRIADDHVKTLLGLPEVKLGLIPGWGGTVRLPRLIGLIEALPMILTGRTLNGRQARSKGLVHDVVPIEALPFVGEELLRTVGKFGTARAIFKRPKRSWLSRLTEAIPPLRSFAFGRAEKETLKQTKSRYPAPLAALETLHVGFRQPPSVGFAAESAAIKRLAESPVTHECLRLFFLQEDAKKPASLTRSVSEGERSTTPSIPWLVERPPSLTLRVSDDCDTQNAAVIGAGAMGSGIALLMAQKGIWTRLKDIKREFLAKGLANARKQIQTDLKRKKITAIQATDTLDRLRPTTDHSGFKHTDIVIEAIVEELAIKQSVFRELAEATSPKTVLATNTSSLLVKEIAAGVPHPERVVGLHFFNPPMQMPLVEIVRTEQASSAALATAFALTQRLGKTAVIVRDCPGFLVNRLLAPYMNEAGYLLLEVDDPLEIDRAAVAFGMPMGPLELTDLVGLDVAQHVAANMHAAYGERMTPAPLWAALKDVASSEPHAAKSLLVGKGSRKKLNPAVRRAIAKVRQSGLYSVPGGTPTRDDVTQRLIHSIINEAARCLDEKIVDKPEDIDLAMVFGTGFAPFRGGPMRFAETTGWNQVISDLERHAAGRPRLAPSAALRILAQGNR